MKHRRTLVVGIQIAQEVISSSPKTVLLVTVERGNTRDTWRMDDVPIGFVVIEQTFKVGHIDYTVLTCIDIEIDIMRLVVLCHICFQQRNALCPVCCGNSRQDGNDDM